MREMTDRGGCRVFGAGLRHQAFATAAVAHVAPHPAVEALAVVPEDVVLSTTTRRRVRGRSHAADRSKLELQPELHDARIHTHRADLSERARTRDITRGVGDIGPVEDVERLPAKPPKSVPAALSRMLKGRPDRSVMTPEIVQP